MCNSKIRANMAWIIVVLTAQVVFSSRAMAWTAGCGDDNDGDIGTPTPITVQNNQSSSYDFTHCFTGGNTAGWNHTESPAPAHGTLQITGSVVTYTPNPGYIGPDFYCLSCSPEGTLAGDGAEFDACGCNLTAAFNVVAPVAPPPPAPVPTLGTWAMFLTGLLLAAISLYRLSRGGEPGGAGGRHRSL
jgi:hypothetical protein